MPRLEIDAALDPLHLDAKRVLVPPAYGRAGWYQAGPEPGEAGRSVIAGHVDSKTGPDVFAALARARKGDRIVVKLADGSMVRFVVDRVETHPQDEFPTAQVYGGQKRRPELRMITCTGAYVGGRYQDNLIVFATLAS
ncbi:MAG: class F sortase [Sporichthya sp.]|nr:class F sortase [Sporichthya sp.]